MKHLGMTLICAGIIAGVGMATYALMNKDTKQKADKLLNTMMDEATSKMKRM